jgi:hypothetical protein
MIRAAILKIRKEITIKSQTQTIDKWDGRKP